ncbi:MAG: WYL domain-containing protein [Actinomycetota bacterium]|nr:WYL domain-containing protein [Actinomycetota bacterium]
MASRPSRLERITNLFLALLETPRPLSLREIGIAVAGYPTEPTALRQAFERDKRTLRDEGVPVAVERIDGEEQVGYRILPEEYYLPDLGLSPREQEALAFALAAVRLEGGVGRSALEKLSPEAVFDLAPMAVLPALPALPVLQEAIRRRCVVIFGYHARTREVEGHELVFRLGAWYFAGRDRSANGELRTFRVDRFETPPCLGEPAAYERPVAAERGEAVRLAPWTGGPALEEGGVAPLQVTLEVDVRELAYARGVFGEHALVERGADGSGRFVFPVADEDAFVAWVLGRGDAVEVIEPPVLRERVAAALAALCGEAS